MIKHIVINGGGPTGLISYGVLKHLHKEEYFNIEDIKTIYGTSIGGIFGVILSLKYDWETLDDYILKRPWEKVFKINPEDFFNLFYSKGLFSFNVVEGFLTKLFEAKDLSINITLSEYYKYNNIEHHFFTVKADTLEIIDLNYKTHPDLPLFRALEMTTAFPIFCKPVFYENECYIDGGMLDNYPVKYCLDNEQCEKEEILGIRNTYPINNTNINENMNLLEYLQNVFGNILDKLQNENKLDNYIPNEVKCFCDKNITNYETWLNNLIEIEKRKELVEYGVNCAEQFLNYTKQLSS
uniref:PNPLA domain-containing protein n=1 Tax=viral metagenome TaxID=1070528 RepID=A0A6C0CIR1_9ZZZZ